MKITHAAAVVTVLTVATLGCGTGTSTVEVGTPGTSDAVASRPPEPHANPVSDPDPAGQQPPGLTKKVTAEQAVQTSDIGEDRVAGERFAVSFAQLVVDVREERDQEALLDDLASDQLPSDIRDFLILDYRELRELGAGRYIDAAYPAMLRSTYEGEESAPTRVNVELGAVYTNAWDDKATLVRVRVDVVPEDGQWKVIDFGGPSTNGVFVEKPEDVKVNLEGEGWRPLPS